MKQRYRHLRLLLVSFAVALAVLVSPLAETATPAQAVVTGFNPGNIVSDSVFYNGAAMSASEVQVFLNQRIAATSDGRCTIGDPGRGAWSAWGSTFIASVCMKDAHFATASRAANAYCAAYPGSAWESTSSIIAKVGQACGISPKVLLVMLEKEQSLVSDTFPTARQYNFAMGYACPDSGPNNSANCDPSQTGFFQQVYRAAWQLKVYRAFPNSYNYKPFQVNTIQWHPNRDCGTSQVYIENWATAALYIYTPYRPNQAALNAGWGTGDACSSYGNRNFYNFYKSWFGSPHASIPVNGKIAEGWRELGGTDGTFGDPVAAAQSSPAHGGGTYQKFEGGIIFAENRSGQYSWMSYGPFLENYENAGFVSGSWGWPTGKAACRLVNGGCTMPFQNGTVAYSPSTGSMLIPEKLFQEWLRLGGVASELGYPLESSVVGAGNAVSQKFVGGYLGWSLAAGAQRVPAAITSAWLAAGGVQALGVPTEPAKAISANGGGTAHELSNGTIWVSPQGTVQMSNGPFKAQYLAAGGPSGSWGWPKTNAACRLVEGGCYMEFQFGTGMWSAGTGLVLVSNEAFAIWNREGGSFGYPIAPPVTVSANGGGVVQEFTRGAVWASPQGTVQMSNGPFKAGYLSAGGPAGLWGWPVNNAVCEADSCSMGFQNGLVNYQSGEFSFTPRG
ncbi:hypothetical protein [Leucobacter sp. W1038]|uniref:hypothetical protein n=1 Tax=Leucobacter sp. W1038 TaxID=3438281 RepID=UPI003D96EE74